MESNFHLRPIRLQRLKHRLTACQQTVLEFRLAVYEIVVHAFDPKIHQSPSFRSKPKIEILDRFDLMFVRGRNSPTTLTHCSPLRLFADDPIAASRRGHRCEQDAGNFILERIVIARST
ncbi:hypothetical protein D3C73_908210 [compost metagenome]